MNIIISLLTSIILSLAKGVYIVAVDSKLAQERDPITVNLASLIIETALAIFFLYTYFNA